MRFTAIYPTSRNFTPSELMQDHAKLNPRASFHRDRYFSSYLLIAGTRYYYDHLKIENGSDDKYMCVTVYLKEKETMTLYDKFKRLAVQADSIEDFCYKYHRREAFHDRGEEYMKYDIEDHKKEFEIYGYTIIPPSSSTTGDVVAYYGKE